MLKNILFCNIKESKKYWLDQNQKLMRSILGQEPSSIHVSCTSVQQLLFNPAPTNQPTNTHITLIHLQGKQTILVILCVKVSWRTSLEAIWWFANRDDPDIVISSCKFNFLEVFQWIKSNNTLQCAQSSGMTCTKLHQAERIQQQTPWDGRAQLYWYNIK